MTINDLMARLEAFLSAALVEVRLETADGEEARPPLMVAGWLPPRGEDGEPRIPYLILRPIKGSDNADGSTVTIQLCLETYSEATAGWMDLTNVIQRIRGALTASPTLGPCCLELPLVWELFDEQPLPQWGAIITTIWTVPRADWLVSTQ